MTQTPLLEVKNLKVEFSTRQGVVTALDNVSISLNAGETLGLVGESGCGKSITALSIMGLVPSPPGRMAGGEILFEGKNLLSADEKRMRSLRGADISMIFQEPMTSLNPVMRAGDQIAEAILLHQDVSRDKALEKSVELLKLVGIPEPERRAQSYPHEMSGGMRQRVMIAIAMSCQPQILIADEPTTALDVTVQAQIFQLMRDIQEELGIAIVMITHDMGAIAEMCDRVAVMYAGRIVEQGSVDAILDNPQHPYTSGLINCIPVLGRDDATSEELHPLAEIPGIVPPLHLIGKGCAFAERCSEKNATCGQSKPGLTSFGGDPNHMVACFARETENIKAGAA